MSRSLTSFIRELLIEGSKPGGDSAPVPVSANNKMSDASKTAGAAKQAPTAKDPTGSYPVGRTIDVMNYADALSVAKTFKITDALAAHKSSANSYAPTGAGVALFGLSSYSPAADVFGKYAKTAFIQGLVEKYKAYGHAFVLFIDDNGDSIRYEFGPAAMPGDCESLPQDVAINKLIVQLEQDPDLLDKVIVNLAKNVGEDIGGSWVSRALSNNASQLNLIPDKFKLAIVKKGVPLMLDNDLGKEVFKSMHFNVPGMVWGPDYGPKNKMLTGTKLKEMLLDRLASISTGLKGEKVELKNYEMNKHYNIDIIRHREKTIVRIRINKAVLDAGQLLSNPPEGQTEYPTGAATDRTLSFVGSSATNLAAGIKYCEDIQAIACDVPYALPAPGIPLPEMIGALNCGLFAANAFNASGTEFKFSLQTSSDQLVSPLSLIDQGWAAASHKGNS